MLQEVGEIYEAEGMTEDAVNSLQQASEYLAVSSNMYLYFRALRVERFLPSTAFLFIFPRRCFLNRHTLELSSSLWPLGVDSGPGSFLACDKLLFRSRSADVTIAFGKSQAVASVRFGEGRCHQHPGLLHSYTDPLSLRLFSLSLSLFNTKLASVVCVSVCVLRSPGYTVFLAPYS